MKGRKGGTVDFTQERKIRQEGRGRRGKEGKKEM